MPIPNPGKKESQKDFIGRCIGHLGGKGEYTPDQRAAICFSQWKKAKAAEAAAETLTGRCAMCGMKKGDCQCEHGPKDSEDSPPTTTTSEPPMGY